MKDCVIAFSFPFLLHSPFILPRVDIVRMYYCCVWFSFVFDFSLSVNYRPILFVALSTLIIYIINECGIFALLSLISQSTVFDETTENLYNWLAQDIHNIYYIYIWACCWAVFQMTMAVISKSSWTVKTLRSDTVQLEVCLILICF